MRSNCWPILLGILSPFPDVINRTYIFVVAEAFAFSNFSFMRALCSGGDLKVLKVGYGSVKKRLFGGAK